MTDVGVMKDEELKLEEIEVSHTLGGLRCLGCHIHVNTLVSGRIQTETGGWCCDNKWTSVDV